MGRKFLDITITEPDDEWTEKLGHANFTIHPEPYLPDIIDIESHGQFLANWKLARYNYVLDLERITEHYGSTSETFKWTREKWAAIEIIWENNYEFIADSLSYIALRIPSLNDGKFPQPGNEGIVGPMERVARLEKRPSLPARWRVKIKKNLDLRNE